ncbi:MAG: hypothetical protein IPJ41_04010 [Phycisphaerales bacterium]|nr:hypothetical protein [Phycisphaerales bacterium]
MCTPGPAAAQSDPPQGLTPGARSILSAHNCYPYQGLWSDRIDRALATGTPVSIEQDLCWVEDPATHEHHSRVAHGEPYTGAEPTLKAHFFERVGPIVEGALASGDQSAWPIIILDLDVKDNSRAHVEAIRDALLEYEPWLTTAERTESMTPRQPLTRAPVLVLLAGDGPQQAVFYDDVPVGEPLIAFARARGNAPPKGADEAGFPPESLLTQPADNFHRWWNNAWHIVEAGGCPNAGDWTESDDARLHALVARAHDLGYFIRFYTIDGCSPAECALRGWGKSYNTGSPEAADTRWRACIKAGVDFIATDDYEGLASALHEPSTRGQAAGD